jgi:hypothetical protein
MGLLDKLFPPKSMPKADNMEFFKMLNGYTPAFSSYNGAIYEMELTRASIHSKAKLIAKLKPEIMGSKYKSFERRLQFRPNPWMNTYQYLYRLCTYLEVNTYTFILPLYDVDEKGKERISGFYPLNPMNVEIVGDKTLYLRYTFANGQKAAIEYDRVGVLSKFSYKSDLLGDGNSALNATMSLMAMQYQGMEEAIRKSASIQFVARVNSTLRQEDIDRQRNEFSVSNLSSDNQSGLIFLDSKIGEFKQIEYKNFVIDEKQMRIIADNVHSYFGTNDDVMQSKFGEDGFNAFYESEIETFALQCSLAHTNMLYTDLEIAYGNEIRFTANRLQYASNKTKLDVINSGLDRGWLNINESREIMNMTGIGEDGDVYRIRLDFVEQSKLNEVQGVEDGK